MRYVSIAEERDGFVITAGVHGMGRDLLVTIEGGSAHIGAIGMAEPRPSLGNSERVSATSSVFTFLGHKEDSLAKFMAEEMARRLNRKTVVVAGAHWDGISEHGIEAVIGICRRLVERIIEEVTRG